MNYLHSFKSHSNSRLCGFCLHHRAERNLISDCQLSDLPSLQPSISEQPLCLLPLDHCLPFPLAFPLGSQSARVLPSHSFCFFCRLLFPPLTCFPSPSTCSLLRSRSGTTAMTISLQPILWSDIYSPSLSWELVLNFQFSAGYFHPRPTEYIKSTNYLSPSHSLICVAPIHPVHTWPAGQSSKPNVVMSTFLLQNLIASQGLRGSSGGPVLTIFHDLAQPLIVTN